MCSAKHFNATYNVKYGVDQKTLDILAEEIKSSEKDLEQAQNNFTQVLLESSASINSLRLKCRICIEEVLNHDRRVPQMEASFVSHKHVACRQIHILQRELESSIVKSSWSTKISFMKLSSLLAQHELLLLPFCELREYYNQLLDHTKHVSKSKHQLLGPKLSYAEALQNMKEISDETEQTKKRILSLTKQRSQDSEVLDYSDIFKNDYKSLP